MHEITSFIDIHTYNYLRDGHVLLSGTSIKNRRAVIRNQHVGGSKSNYL